MHLIEFKAESFKRLIAARFKPKPAGVTKLIGKNGAGKTSVLDAIAAALGGGRMIPAVPIRKGSDEAEIVLDFGEIVVRRRFTDKGSTLEIVAESGSKFKSPQAMLDKLFGERSFDPLAFLRMEPKEQSRLLAKIAGFDLDEWEAERLGVFDSRQNTNRDIKKAETALAVMPKHDAPAVEISVAELSAAIAAVNEKNRAADTAKAAAAESARLFENAAREVDRLSKELAAANVLADKREKELVAVEAAAFAANSARVDPSEIQRRLADATETNRKVRENASRQKFADGLTAMRKKSEADTERLAQLDAERDSSIAEAKFPVKGLALDDRGVVLDGIPLDQMSGAEKLKLSVALGLAQNAEIKLMTIQDGSLLDEEGMATLEQMAADAGAQVLIERVDTGTEIGVVIEDGETINADG